VDSIVYEYRAHVPEIGQAEGYYAECYATDLPGIGNAYWIKTFKNGQFLSKPAEMNLSYDGTMSPGSGTDGIVFIPGVREAINRLPDPDTDDDNDVPPYAPGDHIRVEIHALGPAAYRFLTIAREQMTNGDNSIFARPVTNTPGNITAVTANTPAALGCFNVASVSAAETWVEQ
jgi:hypothetical protein